MKILKKISSDDILTIDIETVREHEELKNAPESFQSAWEYKNKQDGEIPDFLELSRLYENKAPLYAEFSKVCAISLTYLTQEGKLKCKSYAGVNEVEILENFANDLAMFYQVNKSYRLMGHASKFFDFPFLCKRYIINGLDVPPYIDETDKKPWEMRNLCTNELWRSFGTGAGSSLQALCEVLKIPVSKVDMVGDEVGKAYYDGEIQRIGMYCNYDAIATFNVLRKFKRESIFQFEDVEYVTTQKVEKVELPILDVIRNTGTISENQADKLVGQIESGEEKATLDIVTAALIDKNRDKGIEGIMQIPGYQYFCELLESGPMYEGEKFGKSHANQLIKEHKDSSPEVKADVVLGVKNWIDKYNKGSQVRVIAAFEQLQKELS